MTIPKKTNKKRLFDKKIVVPYYESQDYSWEFGLSRKRKNNIYYGRAWSCRESFFYKYNSRNDCFFYKSQTPKQIPLIIKLIKKVEKKLGLSNKNRAKFYYVKPKIVLIKLNWWKPRFRAELFTIFMRAAADRMTCVLKTAMSYDYIRNTEKAVLKFLEGFVKLRNNCNYSFDGWVSVFGDYNFFKFDLVK